MSPRHRSPRAEGPRRVVVLFPSLSSAGGIQTAGRLVLDVLQDTGALGAVLEYDPWGERHRWHRGAAAAFVRTASKFGAVRAAVGLGRGCHVVLVWHVALLRLLPLLGARGARVVVFLHGIEAWRRLPWTTRAFFRAVDLFLANSRYTWERFVATNGCAPGRAFRIVPLGVGEPTDCRPEAFREPAALVLGRMARTEDYKGHRELIQAWPRVTARIPHAQLWVAGDGDLRPELERLARDRGIADCVRFFRFVSDREKADLLARCRCLAMPSRGEGFGLVYLEAMRAGTPCLVSTEDAGREVVNPPEAGLAADPRDPEALADAVCRLLTPGPEWDGWSRRARARYEREYTAAHFQRRLLDALDELWVERQPDPFQAWAP